MKIHHRTCNLCEATCGILVETEANVIRGIRADEEDPFSRGYICPKAYALKDGYEDPDRLERPMVRDGGGWRECTWEDGIAAAAEGIHEVQRQYGKDAVAVYVGNPSVHNLPALFASPAFIRALATRTRFSASSVDQFPRMLASYLVYGGQFSIPVADVDRTDYFMIIGANPAVSNGSLMTAPGLRRRLRAIRERGGKVVVIDPRRNETAALADEHVFIRPGSDSLFLLAILETVFSEGLVELGAAEGRINGLEALVKVASRFPAERVADATAIDAATTRRLARELAAAPSAACYGRVGTCVQAYGTLASVLIDAVNIVTGRLDRLGGVMFPTPAVGDAPTGHYDRWRSRVRGLPEFGGEIPVATLCEEILTPGGGQIRGLFTMAGNPVLSTPNGRLLDRALDSLDFMVSVDPSLNETTRHARVILPPRHTFENEQFSMVFQRLAVRNTAKLSLPVFDPAPDSRSEWEILGALTAALCERRVADAEVDLPTGGTDPFTMNLRDVIEGLLAMGPYDLDVNSLLERPSGIDLGPLEEGRLDAVIRHDDGRVRILCSEIAGEIDRLETELSGEGFSLAADGHLALIGRRQLRSNNSWMHNYPSLMKGPERCTLLVHPSDAARLGIRDGGLVRVRSRVGEVDVPAKVSDEIMAGVVSLPHGFGHDRPGTRLTLAQRRPGVSMNDLTDEAVTEGLMGNAVLTGVPVHVTAL